MARFYTATVIKGRRKVTANRTAPKEGSALRKFYDRFISGEGVAKKELRGTAKNQLEDFYGLDIHLSSQGHYYLAGEWQGCEYVPIERMIA